jgi:hypothetical protein
MSETKDELIEYLITKNAILDQQIAKLTEKLDRLEQLEMSNHSNRCISLTQMKTPVTSSNQTQLQAINNNSDSTNALVDKAVTLAIAYAKQVDARFR